MIEHATVRLSAAVMTHPERRPRAVAVCRQLGDLAAELVVDPDPGRPESVLRNARRAWARVHPEATHHLVLQDDIQVGAGFVSQLLAAVADRPDHAISLFTEWGSYSSYAVRLAALAGCGWAPVLDPYTPSVALVLPARQARAFAADTDLSTPQDDVSVSRVLLRHNVPRCVVVPNLVEHVGEHSLVGNGRMGVRRSVLFGQRDTSAGGELLCDIPFFATDTLRPMAMVRESNQPEGRMIEFTEFLTRQQIDPSDAFRTGVAGRQAVEALLATEPALDASTQFVLGGLRYVLYALGHQVGRYGNGIVDLHGIRTVAAGALRWNLEPARIEQLEPLTRSLFLDTVHHGVRDGAARRCEEGVTR